MSIVLHPLHQLLGESREWQWSEQCELAFTEAKGMITSEQVLMRYDPALPVRLHQLASVRFFHPSILVAAKGR